MTIPSTVKKQIYRELDNLSPDALAQVARVVNTLQTQAKPPVCLAGLWSDIPFDIDNRTVRSLRRRVSRQTLKRKV